MTAAPTPRRIDSPVPGFYLLRLVPGGPEVPACLCFEADATGAKVMVAYILNKPVSIAEVWHRRSRVIDQDDYRLAMAKYDYETRWLPGSPLANPERKVDLSRQPAIF